VSLALFVLTGFIAAADPVDRVPDCLSAAPGADTSKRFDLQPVLCPSLKALPADESLPVEIITRERAVEVLTRTPPQALKADKAPPVPAPAGR